MPRDLEIRCRRVEWGTGIEVLVGARGDSGRVEQSARVVEFRPIVEGELLDPTLTLSAHTAQRLIDELWSCGFRPTEGTGSAGSLAATERHLDDMKRIAFAALKLARIEA